MRNEKEYFDLNPVDCVYRKPNLWEYFIDPHDHSHFILLGRYLDDDWMDGLRWVSTKYVHKLRKNEIEWTTVWKKDGMRLQERC